MYPTDFPRAPLVSVPEFLPAQYRGGDEDWRITLTRWITPPAYAADGLTVITPGEPRDLTGCSTHGLLYRRDFFERFPLGSPVQAPIALAGEMADPTSGEFDLVLGLAVAGTLTVQDRFDPRSRYVLRALITELDGRTTWAGTVPVFVL